jgi:hypothetical protein
MVVQFKTGVEPGDTRPISDIISLGIPKVREASEAPLLPFASTCIAHPQDKSIYMESKSSTISYIL